MERIELDIARAIKAHAKGRKARRAIAELLKLSKERAKQ